jgi:hypothetical protein
MQCEVIANWKVTGRVSDRFHLGAQHRTKVTLIYKSWILDQGELCRQGEISTVPNSVCITRSKPLILQDRPKDEEKPANPQTRSGTAFPAQEH